MSLNKRLIRTNDNVVSGYNYLDMQTSYMLTRSQTTPTDSTKYTFSFWIKFDSISWSGGDQFLLGTGNFPSPAREEFFAESTNKYRLNFDSGAANQGFYDQSIAASISTGQWYHYVISKQVGNPPTLYINSVAYSFTGSSAADTGATRINSGSELHRVFRAGWAASNGVDGKVSQLQFVDGQTLLPSDFSNTVGSQYTPKNYAGSFGNNGWQILIENTGDALNDTSGNNNDLSMTGSIVTGSEDIIT